jgi:hypothetical protein
MKVMLTALVAVALLSGCATLDPAKYKLQSYVCPECKPTIIEIQDIPPRLYPLPPLMEIPTAPPTPIKKKKVFKLNKEAPTVVPKAQKRTITPKGEKKIEAIMKGKVPPKQTLSPLPKSPKQALTPNDEKKIEALIRERAPMKLPVRPIPPKKDDLVKDKSLEDLLEESVVKINPSTPIIRAPNKVKK